MPHIAQIVLGVDDEERASAFWAAALGYVRRPARHDDDWIVLVPPPGRSGSPIAFDVSGTPPQRFPRVHLDLDLDEDVDGDLDTELDRLLALGARHVDWPGYPWPGERPPDDPPYVVLADPEGNVFCLSGRRRPPG
jgi:catechol 2,3-dioxygenase-like lactoylglutathione lyase family enzyme